MYLTLLLNDSSANEEQINAVKESLKHLFNSK